jgi:hypothetical protein
MLVVSKVQLDHRVQRVFRVQRVSKVFRVQLEQKVTKAIREILVRQDQ